MMWLAKGRGVSHRRCVASGMIGRMHAAVISSFVPVENHYA